MSEKIKKKRKRKLKKKPVQPGFTIGERLPEVAQKLTRMTIKGVFN